VDDNEAVGFDNDDAPVTEEEEEEEGRIERRQLRERRKLLFSAPTLQQVRIIV
jgi:hypothetical protein